jgi:hypothetical protein
MLGPRLSGPPSSQLLLSLPQLCVEFDHASIRIAAMDPASVAFDSEGRCADSEGAGLDGCRVLVMSAVADAS